MTLAPALIHEKRPIWYPGPTIRECCLEANHGLSLAAWWWECAHRFDDLSDGLLDPEITAALLEQRDYVEGILEDRVPRPHIRDVRAYEAYRVKYGGPRRKKNNLAKPLEQLGLPWPCSKEQLDQRWKAILKSCHPDHGGDTPTFIRLKAVYEQVAPIIRRTT